MYEIPVLHPLVVHFPVAYLLLAGVTGPVWGLTGRRGWRNLTALLLAVGALGAGVALTTGEEMAERSGGMPVVQELVGLHETLGWLSLSAASGALLLMAIGLFTGQLRRSGNEPEARHKVVLRVVVALLCVAAAALVVYTGHLGGQMSWGEEVR